MMKKKNITKNKSLAIFLGLGTLLFSACPSSNTKSGIQPVANAYPTHAQEQPEVKTDNPLLAPIFPKEEFRNQQPVANEPKDFNLPGIKQFTIANQIEVYLVERHDLPTLTMNLNFNGGTIYDRSGKEGTAEICMSMVTEGTKTHDKLSFEAALADIASTISSYSSKDSQGIVLRSLSKNFEATFALLTETLLEPGFREPELNRMIDQELQYLKQAKGSPNSIAQRLLPSIIAGPNHPFGRFTSKKSLQRLNIKDCKIHFKSYVKPKGARLFVVGDTTKEKLIQAFTPLLKKWKGRAKRVPSIPKIKGKRNLYFVDIPGAAQSSIFIIHPGPKRDTPDYYVNQLMTGVLGGGFASRINMNLREDKGYSYGARGAYKYNKHFGTFIASSSVRSDSTNQSLEEVFKEMSFFKSGEKPVTPEELNREKNGLILGLPARFATAGQVLQVYYSLYYLGLPFNYYNSYIKNVEVVTKEQVQTATKLLHPEFATIFVVGDSSTKQIVRKDGKDQPRLMANTKDQRQMTLIDALQELAASELGGVSRVITLDVNGNIKK